MFSQTSTRKSKSQSPRQNKQTYFKDVLTEAGVVLKSDGAPNVITQEQSLVVRDINKCLKQHIIYPNNIDDFIAGIKDLCKDESCFQRALLPTELKKNDFENMVVQQDSLVRMLLNVTCIQNHIAELLLDQLTSCAPEAKEDTAWVRLLLNPLRYLSTINDSTALVTTLLDILEIATFEAQLEMLNLIPEITPDNEYETTAKALTKLLQEKADLTGAIIDCLNSLNLSTEMRSEIQELILARLEASASAKIFPILFEFLIIDCTLKNLQSVLGSSRNALDKIMGMETGDDKEKEANKVLIFNKLETFATSRKSLCEGWFNVLSSAQAEPKVVDLLLLFMLHAVGNPRKTTIEGLFRKRIKSGMFKIPMLEALFKKYFVTQILKDQLNSIIAVGLSLLRNNEPLFNDFATMMFKLLFGHRLIERVQRQEIIHSLLTGFSDKKSVGPVLNVLLAFREDFAMLQQHTVQLMGLLEKLDAINLHDAKIIFELLCGLTCGEKADESMSGWRDELHMVIRKQLSSSKKNVKHRGIVAAVVMVKILATTSEAQPEIKLDDNSMTIDDLPRGNPQEAAGLLMLANSSTLECPDSMGLYYDQIAEMLITAIHLDLRFLAWLCSMVTNDFQHIFITESTPGITNNMQVSMQFSLNTSEEMDSPIAIKIGELCIKQSYDNSILMMAPLFRVVRLTHFRQYNKDLSTIDALLGCSILMPKLEDLDNYDNEQVKVVADCVFHCINWFREVISAFVTQKNRKLRQKVLERLIGTVQLEEILDKCMEAAPNHKLPPSYFDSLSQLAKPASPVKAKPKPRKRQKTSDATAAINPDETAASVGPSQPPKPSIRKKETQEKELTFREMDTDVILLMRYPLKVNEDIDSSFSQITGASQITTLGINQLKFLLRDFVLKLEILVKQKNVEFSHINIVNPSDFISDCVRLLPSIKKHLNTSITYLADLIKKTDGCVDSELIFTTEANTVKTIFALIIKSYALIFSWSGFQYTKNLNLLKDCFKVLREDSVSQLTSVKTLIMEFLAKLSSYVEYCLYLPGAISLVETAQALYLINSHADIKKRIAVMAGKLLTKKWYGLNGQPESGKTYSLSIDVLVKAYLSESTVKTLYGLVGTLQNQAPELKLKEDSLEMLASINKVNFYIFYRSLCANLLEAVKNEVAALTNNQHLVLWRTTVLTMQGLMSVAKIQENRTNLISFLRNSIGILKVFLASGIPILEIMLKSKPDEVVEIFKIMQTSTRFLHHLCCYSKFINDASLLAYVPQFRFLLESLVYRVKAALVANGCSDAFWMGVLRNRDLHGDDILSQSSLGTGSTEAEEELPPDEDEEEQEEQEEQEQGGNDSDTSETY